MKKLLTLVAFMISIPIIASCDKQEKKNTSAEADKTEQTTEASSMSEQESEEVAESQAKVPEFAKLLALINATYDNQRARKDFPSTDSHTGMKRIAYDKDVDDSEGIVMEMVIVAYGKGTDVIKTQDEEGFEEWNYKATDAHACYVSFHFDTDNGAIIAFKSKADAEACARQMKPLLQQSGRDLKYGSATIDKYYCGNIEPTQNEEGWWIFDFHAG